MNLRISDFLMHGEESSKLSRHVIELGKRSLMSKWMVIIYWFFPLILDNHVVHGHTND
jgi:hypothetical protein